MKKAILMPILFMTINPLLSTSISTNSEADMVVQGVVAAGICCATAGSITIAEQWPLTPAWHGFTTALAGLGTAATIKAALHPHYPDYNFAPINLNPSHTATAYALFAGVAASYFYWKLRPNYRAYNNDRTCSRLAEKPISLSLLESEGKDLTAIETNMGNIAALSGQDYLLPEAVRQVDNYVQQVQSAQDELTRLESYPSLRYTGLHIHKDFLNEKLRQAQFVLREVKSGERYRVEKKQESDAKNAQRALEIEEQKALAEARKARAAEKSASAKTQQAATQSNYFILDLLKWLTRTR